MDSEPHQGTGPLRLMKPAATTSAVHASTITSAPYDTLHVPDADQMVVVYSAEPGTSVADALALLGVVGTQALVDSSEV